MSPGNLRKPQNSVHRRTDVVRHVEEKLTLGEVRGFFAADHFPEFFVFRLHLTGVVKAFVRDFFGAAVDLCLETNRSPQHQDEKQQDARKPRATL